MTTREPPAAGVTACPLRPPAFRGQARGATGRNALAACLALVAALHAAMLAAAWHSARRPALGVGEHVRHLEVRQITAPPQPQFSARSDAAPMAAPRPASPEPAATAAMAAAPPAPARGPSRTERGAAAGTAAPASEPPPQQQATEPPRHSDAAPAAARAATANVEPSAPELDLETFSAGPAPAPGPLPGGAALPDPAPPLYRTAAPPSAALLFDMQRGAVAGQAELAWRLGPDGRYDAELRVQHEAEAAAASAPATRRRAAAALAALWKSQGTLDAGGLAPERFAVARRGRERHAANFQREAGIVTFSGPSRTWPLVAGAQDRLSWIVQLAAILQAEPQLLARHQLISMMVVGAHGDAAGWTFTVHGASTLEGPGGVPLEAWYLRREAQHAHDAEVEVWVAPQLQHWPLKLRLTHPLGRESTEWRLRALRSSP